MIIRRNKIMNDDEWKNYDDMCTYLYKKYQDALTKGDLELAARLYRAQIAFKAPLKVAIFSEEFKKSLNQSDDKVLAFIKRFEGSEETFTSGCCYWFARILCERFDISLYKTTMMYNNIDGHFAAKINGRLYDITGELNETADWKTWDEFRENEPIYAQTVIRDCIKKLG